MKCDTGKYRCSLLKFLYSVSGKIRSRERGGGPHCGRANPPPKPIVYFGEEAFAKQNACIARPVYFAAHMRLAIIAGLRIPARNDSVCAPPGCLAKDAVVCKPFDASTSLGPQS
jgi:hypothetical protein